MLRHPSSCCKEIRAQNIRRKPMDGSSGELYFGHNLASNFYLSFAVTLESAAPPPQPERADESLCVSFSFVSDEKKLPAGAESLIDGLGFERA